MEIFWGVCSRLVCAPRMPLLYLETYLLFHLSGKQWSDSCHIQICSLELLGTIWAGMRWQRMCCCAQPRAQGAPAAPGGRMAAGSSVPNPAATKQAGLSLFMQEILYLHSSFLYRFGFVGWWLSCYSATSCREHTSAHSLSNINFYQFCSDDNTRSLGRHCKWFGTNLKGFSFTLLILLCWSSPQNPECSSLLLPSLGCPQQFSEAAPAPLLKCLSASGKTMSASNGAGATAARGLSN